MSGQDQPQRQVIRTHGRTHLPGGSDPIPGLGTSAYQFITEKVVADAAGYMDFDDIPQGFRHLVLELALNGSTGHGIPTMDFNGAEDSGYWWEVTAGNNGSTFQDSQSSSFASANCMSLGNPIDGLTESTDGFSVITVKFPYYSNADIPHAGVCHWQWGNGELFSHNATNLSGAGGFNDDAVIPLTRIRVWSQSDPNPFSSGGPDDFDHELGDGSCGSLYGIM